MFKTGEILYACLAFHVVSKSRLKSQQQQQQQQLQQQLQPMALQQCLQAESSI